MEATAYKIELSFDENLYDQITSFLYEIELTTFAEGQEKRDLEGDIYLINENSFITLFFEKEVDVINFNQTIKVKFPLIDTKISEITEDYQNAWKEFAGVTQINERIIISPSWIDNKESFDKEIIIKIDPAYAFGSGSHPTTILCLKFLDKYRAYLTGNSSLLDVGSGSGILSILASKLGAHLITGIDIDELAVQSAYSNSKLNNCTNIKYSTEKLPDIKEEFNIVVVNIISSVIIELQDDITKLVRPDGIIILSGILESEISLIKFPKNFSKIDQEIMDGWASLVFKNNY